VKDYTAEITYQKFALLAFVIVPTYFRSKRLMKLGELLRRLRKRGRSVNLTLLRLFLRVVPSESHRVFGVALAAGAFCGLAAVSFHLAIIAAENILIGRAFHASGQSRVWLIILIPTIGALLSGLILQFIVPGARGSGVPQVKVAYAVRGGRVPLIEAAGKFLVGVLQIGSGSSLGREGPTVQICAGIATSLGRAAALSRENLRRLLPVGAAAGIAAAFNAPIAAVTFTIEEVVGDLDQAVLAWIVVAAAIAAAVERAILGEHPVFTITRNYGLGHASSLLSYAALGVAAAAVSLIFTESLLSLRNRFQHMTVIPAWLRPAVGGLVTGVLAVMALRFLDTAGITGGGYATLSEALSGSLAIRVLLVLCALKIVATVFSYASGGAGGILAPALFIGGMLGGVFGYIDMQVFHHSSVDIAEGGLLQPVSTIVQSSPHVQPDDTLVRAVVKMERSGSRQLAVVDAKDSHRLIGLLTMSDVVRAHARAAIDAGDYDRPELPALSGNR